MTPTEVARLHPLRIDVVAVKGGQGVADLAARMEGTERSLDLFRLLNGLAPGDALVAGQRVKIVVD
jgi:predicted Zn-dependent protease